MIYIVSSDKKLRTMLKIELEAAKLDCEIIENLSRRRLTSGILLADLDDMPEIPPTFNAVVGWTRNNLLNGQKYSDVCSVIIHRPFSVSSLCEYLCKLSQDSNLKQNPAAHTELPVLLTDGTACEYNGAIIPLTPSEYSLLGRLISAGGKTVTVSQLQDLLGADSDTVRVYVCNIRAKLSRISDTPVIRTVRGEGYRINIRN